MITPSTPALLASSRRIGEGGHRYFELGSPLFSHAPPAVPSETALQRRATPKGWAAADERPAEHLNPSLARLESWHQ